MVTEKMLLLVLVGFVALVVYQQMKLKRVSKKSADRKLAIASIMVNRVVEEVFFLMTTVTPVVNPEFQQMVGDLRVEYKLLVANQRGTIHQATLFCKEILYHESLKREEFKPLYESILEFFTDLEDTAKKKEGKHCYITDYCRDMDTFLKLLKYIQSFPKGI